MLPDARPRFGAALSTHTFAADVVVPLGDARAATARPFAPLTRK